MAADEHVDGLAGVEAVLVVDREVVVLAAGHGERFAGVVVQALAGDDADAGFRGDGEDGVGAVRQVVFVGYSILVVGVLLGLLPVGRRDLALGGFKQCGQRAVVCVDVRLVGLGAAEVGGERRGLLCLGGVAVRLAELLALLEQRIAGAEVARRCGARLSWVSAQLQATFSVQGALPCNVRRVASPCSLWMAASVKLSIATGPIDAVAG